MGKKILICDDAGFMRMVIKNCLEQQGYDIVGEAEDGEQAITMYKILKPDLITMDITMPKISGIEALEQIIRIDSNANVLMCSAMGQQELVIRAIKLGARDFIVKPFEINRLQQAVSKILGEKYRR